MCCPLLLTLSQGKCSSLLPHRLFTSRLNAAAPRCLPFRAPNPQSSQSPRESPVGRLGGTIVISAVLSREVKAKPYFSANCAFRAKFIKACKRYQSEKLGISFRVGCLLFSSCMNESTNNKTIAHKCSSPLKLRLSIPRNRRLEYVESVLNVLNESRFGYMLSDIYLGQCNSYSEAEVEVGDLETKVLFRPSWTAYSKFIPSGRSVSVSFGEGLGVSGTSISSFANLASLRETGFFNAKIAKDAKKRKDLAAVFGTSVLDLHQVACPATGPPSK